MLNEIPYPLQWRHLWLISVGQEFYPWNHSHAAFCPQEGEKDREKKPCEVARPLHWSCGLCQLSPFNLNYREQVLEVGLWGQRSGGENWPYLLTFFLRKALTSCLHTLAWDLPVTLHEWGTQWVSDAEELNCQKAAYARQQRREGRAHRERLDLTRSNQADWK